MARLKRQSRTERAQKREPPTPSKRIEHPEVCEAGHCVLHCSRRWWVNHLHHQVAHVAAVIKGGPQLEHRSVQWLGLQVGGLMRSQREANVSLLGLAIGSSLDPLTRVETINHARPYTTRSTRPLLRARARDPSAHERRPAGCASNTIAVAEHLVLPAVDDHVHVRERE